MMSGQLIVSEAAARLDLASEYGVLFANYRGVVLDNEALTRKMQIVLTELTEAKQSCAVMSEKYRELSNTKEELARQLRTRLKPKKG